MRPPARNDPRTQPRTAGGGGGSVAEDSCGPRSAHASAGDSNLGAWIWRGRGWLRRLGGRGLSARAGLDLEHL
eukprot:3832222-Alexandrium_andersonii.AAC.1